MSDERELGMDRPISRRDFLDGVAVGVGGAMALPSLLQASQEVPSYPPALTGLRGAHAGAYEAFHSLRDGTLWSTTPAPASTGERYDLVVVGAGISGLAAAHYYRQAQPSARILILDNHDDFGGHAKRNEFTHEGQTFLGYGGTFSIESPLPYSPVAKGLLRELGIDVGRYATYHDAGLYRGLGLRGATFFDRETYGTDKLVFGAPGSDGFAAAAPISEAARQDLRRLTTDRFDPYPGLSESDIRARLARVSYADYLTRVLGLDPGVVALYQTVPHGLFGAGIDVVPAQDAYGLGLPGFAGLQLGPAPGPGQNYDAQTTEEAERFFCHFPDGNATIARLLVRRLIPGSIPGTSAEDVVTARADYGRLDRSANSVRIRLNSPVVRVRHEGATGSRVEVTYVAAGKPVTVSSRSVVLACWHATIPYLCPELPAKQKEALAFAIKIPLVYTNVLIRNWTSFQKLGLSGVSAPGGWHTEARLDLPVSVGGYHHSKQPTDPVVLHLAKAMCKPGHPIREQHRLGRTELFSTPFPTIERKIRDQLGRVLGAGGFDPARDILGITVNRWPHGYAYQYNSLYDDFWFEGKPTPCEAARVRFGRIAFANADAGAYSYTDAAIDHAYRAVQDLRR